MSAGTISQKFVDINKIVHKFPQELTEIGFSVTLLHNHPHAPKNYVLLYENDFTKSRYVSLEEAEEYFPCSWYEQDGEIITYEFCDQKLEYSQEEIKENLKVLELRGFKNYGTTVRPIKNQLQLETKQGHIYIPAPSPQNHNIKKIKVSETCSNGKSLTQCSAYSYCYTSSMYAHVTGYGHQVW